MLQIGCEKSNLGELCEGASMGRPIVTLSSLPRSAPLDAYTYAATTRSVTRQSRAISPSQARVVALPPRFDVDAFLNLDAKKAAADNSVQSARDPRGSSDCVKQALPMPAPCLAYRVLSRMNSPRAYLARVPGDLKSRCSPRASSVAAVAKEHEAAVAAAAPAAAAPAAAAPAAAAPAAAASPAIVAARAPLATTNAAISSTTSATPASCRPTHGFVSHAEWAPDSPFICHAPPPAAAPASSWAGWLIGMAGAAAGWLTSSALGLGSWTSGSALAAAPGDARTPTVQQAAKIMARAAESGAHGTTPSHSSAALGSDAVDAALSSDAAYGVLCSNAADGTADCAAAESNPKAELWAASHAKSSASAAEATARRLQCAKSADAMYAEATPEIEPLVALEGTLSSTGGETLEDNPTSTRVEGAASARAAGAAAAVAAAATARAAGGVTVEATAMATPTARGRAPSLPPPQTPPCPPSALPPSSPPLPSSTFTPNRGVDSYTQLASGRYEGHSRKQGGSGGGSSIANDATRPLTAHIVFSAPSDDASNDASTLFTSFKPIATLSGGGADAKGEFCLAGDVWPTGKVRFTRTRPGTPRATCSRDIIGVTFEGIYHHAKLAGRYSEPTAEGRWAEYAFVLRLATVSAEVCA